MTNFRPNFIFLDSVGKEITQDFFGKIIRGHSSDIHTLKLKNLGDPIDQVLIRPVATVGSTPAISSVQSTYLSSNGVDYASQITVSLALDETVPFYLKWQPPSDAIPGDDEWTLEASVDMVTESEVSC